MSPTQNYNSKMALTDTDLGFNFDIPTFADVGEYESELRYTGTIGTTAKKALGCLRMKF